MANNSALKQQAMSQLRGFDNEKHAKSLADGLLRSCKDPNALTGRLSQANAVVSALRTAGVTSFFAAEYAKVFTDGNEALTSRSRMIVDFQMQHGLPEGRAAKMADCIVFCAAKRQDPAAIARMWKIASESLAAEVPFPVVADVVYYSPPDVSAEAFAQRCVTTAFKKSALLDISPAALAAKLREI